MASGRDLSIQVLQSQVMEALRAKDYVTAHRYCQSCLKLNAVDPVSLHLQGVVCLEQGKYADASAWVKRALESNPRYAQAFNTLGVISDRSGKKLEALQAFQESIKLFPDDPDVLKNLAMAHFHRGDFDQTKILLKKGLSINPNHSGLLTSLGLFHMKCKQFDLAQQAYEKVIAKAPNFVDAHFNLAWTLEQQNQMDSARAGYEKVIELNPSHCKAYYSLSGLKKVESNDPNFIALEQLKRSQSLSLQEVSDLYFALAKMYADIGNNDAAFFHYHCGNEAWKQLFPYDAIAHRQNIDQLIAATPSELFENQDGMIDSDRPTFVIGMPRSGTTLVEQILASHPAVYGAGELEWMGRLSNHCFRQKATIQEAIQTLTPHQKNAYGQEYLRQLKAINAEATHVVDKMPDNFQSLWFIAQLFPKAKVLHLRRNPLDTCIACYTTHFFAGHPYTSDLTELGMYYADYRRLMEHWHSVLPIEILDVDYEALVTNQEEESRRMIEFLGLEWDEKCLEFYTHERAVSTASVVQVRQPIYTSSINRWKRYEAHLSSLIKELQNLL